MTSPPARIAEQLGELYVARDVRSLARVLFDRHLYPGQCDIAALTAFLEHPRAAVCCYTQYGKTFGMGTGLAIDLVLDPVPRKIAMVGPRAEQAKLIRSHFLGAATSSPLGSRELGLTRKGAERLKSKSVNHFVTRHGKEIKVLTTGTTGDAGQALMGHGVDNTRAPTTDGDVPLVDDEPRGEAGVVVVTEAGLIPENAWPKIRRMLGDRGVLIAEGNPWRKGTGFHALWEAPSTHRIHIDVEQGIREGRLRRERVEEERAAIPALFYMVLYESIFPNQAEDQLIAWDHIMGATEAQLELPASAERRWGLDVAEGGADLTVLSPLSVAKVFGKDQYRAARQEATSEPDPLKIADWVAERVPAKGIVVVDSVGPGNGVASALERKGYSVRRFKAGESAREDDKYRNKGSEAYWQARVAFQERRIQIPNDSRLTSQLQQPVWFTDGKRVAVDKHGTATKSPDYADSLVMAMHGAGMPAASSAPRRDAPRAPRDLQPGDFPGIKTHR